MDWVALRRALLVFQTCSPLENPRRPCAAKTADMANAACVSFQFDAFDLRGSESTWSENIANLGDLVFYNALQAPLWRWCSVCLNSYGRLALSLGWFLFRISCILWTGHHQRFALWTFCIDLANTIDFGALSVIAREGHLRSLARSVDHVRREVVIWFWPLPLWTGREYRALLVLRILLREGLRAHQPLQRKTPLSQRHVGCLNRSARLALRCLWWSCCYGTLRTGYKDISALWRWTGLHECLWCPPCHFHWNGSFADARHSSIGRVCPCPDRVFVCICRSSLGRDGNGRAANSDLTGRSCRHYVCFVIAEDDAFKKHYWEDSEGAY